jgi:H+/Cl- antiporter ClcA
VNHRAPLTTSYSTLLAVAKFGTILLTTASGYGAGIVYPLMMVGYLLGPLVAKVLRPDDWGGHDIELAGTCTPAACVAPPGVFVPEPRDGGVELVAQLLGSGFLAATMRAPLGTAILVAFMSSAGTLHETESSFLAVLLLTNFIAVAVNTDSAVGQKGY